MRKTKFVKNDKNEDVEVYCFECNVCSKEMIFPKKEADQVEKMFPFITEKVNKGSPCLDCAVLLEKDNKYIFSEEESNVIRSKILELQNDTKQ